MVESTDQPEQDPTVYSTEDEDQLQPEDTLEDRGVDDVLDEGYSPPERLRAADQHGTTSREQREGETLDDRLEREVPDPTSAYGAPENESGQDNDQVGGDEPEAIDAADDFVGGEVGDERAGRLVADDEGTGSDDEDELVAGDVGIDGAGASAEEAAVHRLDQERDGEE